MENMGIFPGNEKNIFLELRGEHLEGVARRSNPVVLFVPLFRGTNDGEIVESVLSPDINTLEPKLARHGYGIAVLCEHLSARRNEVRAYLKGQLTAGKTEEFNK